LQKHFVAMAMSEGLEIWKKKNAKGEVDPGKKGMKFKIIYCNS
jgi:hypothetical protein